MAYVNFSDTGSTLTADERSEEARRILDRFKNIDPMALAEDGEITENAARFLWKKLQYLTEFGTVEVTVKELYWLRGLNDRL